MERRDFLKNSLFALFSTAIASNKVLASVAETLSPTSPKILLYLVETVKGDLKVRATKWVDLPIKRLIPSEVKPETFKALEIVDIDKVYERRSELWKEHNCTGRMGHLVSLGLPMTDEMSKEYGDFNTKTHKGVKRNETTKRKISEKAIGRPSSKKGKKMSEEIKSNMSEGAKNRKYTDEGRKKRKEWMLKNNPFRGKKHTEEKKQLILDKHPSKIKVTCEHCNKNLDLPNYKRYHGEKCKSFNPNGYNEKFLFSDKSIKIIDLLEKNVSYSQITKQTGYSKNTIIKTNRLYKSVFSLN